MGLAEALHLVRDGRYAGLSGVCRVVTDRKVVALTFDDGPDPAYTPGVLAILNRYDARATFFLMGEHAESFPALVQAELEAGMEVGDHTWSHPHLSALTTADAVSEAASTAALLADAGGAVTLFRAPYGEITAAQLEAVNRLGLEPVQWSLPLDHYVGGMGLAPEAAATAIARDVRPGDIILAHDAHVLPQDGGLGRASAMATLRLLVPALKRRGFQITTASDLLEFGPAVRAVPRPWFWQSGFTCPRR